MPRKCEPSLEVKKIIWDIAVSVGKANTEAISRQLDYQLDKLRNVDIFEDTPGHRAIRRIVNKDINALPQEVVMAKLPPHVWLLRNDYESVKKLANTMRAEEAPKQRPYEETPHKQRLRELATRLGNEIGLPVVFESFVVDLKPGNVLHLGSLTIRVSDKGKLEVGLSIETETSITHLYHGLLSHLKTGGFEAVLVDILNWKQGAAEDLKRCSKLITLAQEEIERTYDIKIAMNCQGQRGFTMYFPKTICAAAIEQARGSN